MPHDDPLITTIVGGLVLAFIFGTIANRFRIPPLVGYLVAGVVAGPYTPGFVADQEVARQLSEIGVILLMFGVGLHFSLKDLLSVQAVAIPGALGRIAAATLMGLGLALLLGWSVGAGLIFGLALSVASTVVLLKTLQDRHLVDSEKGRIAVGWVIVEDIAMVLALVLIPALASVWGGSATQPSDPFVSFVERLSGVQLGVTGVLTVTIVKLAAFVGFMLVVGRRLIPMVLHLTAHAGSRELFRLAVLAIALGVAAGSAYLFGVSLALGAFFAGMILSESELSHRAAQETLPLRDAFAVLFFVAVGMLFDPTVLIHDPLPILAALFIIVVGKSVLAYLIVILFRRPVGTALTIAASLAQIGEFSLILATLGVDLGVLPAEGRDLILAGAILSIVLNPVMFWIADTMGARLEARSAERPGDTITAIEPALEPRAEAAPAAERPAATGLSGHTVLIGYGRVGSVVAAGLLQAGRPFVLIEDAEGRVAAAHAAGIEVIAGNAASREVLEMANVAGAATVIIAIPNTFEAGQAAEQCRNAAGGAAIIARAHSDEEEAHLRHLGADTVIMGEREIAMAMLERIDAAPPPAASASVAPAPAAPVEEPAVATPAAAIRRPARQAATPYATESERPAGRGRAVVPEVLPEPGTA